MLSLWAIAKNTFKMAVRMKVFVALSLLMLIMLIAMGVTMDGDGTVKGRLQTFVTYSFSLTSLILSLFSIIMSTYTMTSDIKGCQMYTVLTKPVKRYQIILGKLLGIMLINVCLLAMFSSVIYGVVIYMPKYLKASPKQMTILNDEFYTARVSAKPVQKDFSNIIDKSYKQLKNRNQLPMGYSDKKIHNLIKRREQLAERAVEVGQDKLWHFDNINLPNKNNSIFVKFKYETPDNPPNLDIKSRWIIGDNRPVSDITTKRAETYAFERKDLIRTVTEIKLPADAVADDGYLAVGFLNMQDHANRLVIFPLKDGLEVLYKADSFTLNFIRCVLLIFIKVTFLACLGLFAASFLSFPVAIMLCLVIFTAGAANSFIVESFDSLKGSMSNLYDYTFRPFVFFLPQFDKFQPAKYLVASKLLSWSQVAAMAMIMIGVKAMLLLVVAVWIFAKREIAKVII